ncbi:alpha/beta hydrolase [Kibdelosporangium philippinense]|uniref:Alpha/beta hydrolase n=1 Tax=Kibdelosporangium philippinense TaxID=211113 RepID=A0ABS8Z8T0_9PSEU|nr:alpha/beta hydrolase [Kibdelosporangium philippinense]MCE7004276.1 alpha/beta hydrolase [Kibdelosporangium philippinense]
MIRRLPQADVTARAVANPLRGLTYDSAYVANAIADVEGPVVLVGHSYAGAVIGAASAQAQNVTALVYVAAFVPDEGESPFELTARFAESDLGNSLRPSSYPLPEGGTALEMYMSDDAFRHVLAADLPEDVTSVLVVSQRPVAANALGEKSGPVGWKSLPSWHAIATADHALNPEVQRFGAKRAGSTTVEIDGSHLIHVTY